MYIGGCKCIYINIYIHIFFVCISVEYIFIDPFSSPLCRCAPSVVYWHGDTYLGILNYLWRNLSVLLDEDFSRHCIRFEPDLLDDCMPLRRVGVSAGINF